MRKWWWPIPSAFIRGLPVTLVDAFKATLEEITEADLVLHVIDASAADADELRGEVLGVLADIGAAKVPTVEVLNKIDLLAPSAAALPGVDGVDQVAVSALTGEGIDALRDLLRDRLGVDAVTTEVRLPPSGGKARSWLYEHGDVRREDRRRGWRDDPASAPATGSARRAGGL